MQNESAKKLPLIIAHRGESFDAPENTLAAINLAWQRNDEAVEIDVNLTADNQIVVIHDNTTKRTGNINLRIKKCLLEDLRKVDVGSFKDSKWKGERIPLLSEVLLTVPQGKKLIIEIKSNKKIIPFLREELLQFREKSDQIQIIGFNRNVVTEAKKQMPEFKVLWLLNLDYNWFTKLTSLKGSVLLQKAKKSGLDGIDAFAGKRLTESFSKKAKSMNLLVYAWTVDDFKHAVLLTKNGIDAITTNRCHWIKSKLNEYSNEKDK